MTIDQGTSLMAYLLACYPTAAAPEATQVVYLQHLEPLPYERTEKAIKQLVLTRVYPTLPTIAEVVQAAGVGDDASRALLLRAIAERQPLVRDAAHATGWAVGRAVLPPEALPPRRPSLPQGPLVEPGTVRALIGRFAGALRGGDEPVAGEWK